MRVLIFLMCCFLAVCVTEPLEWSPTEMKWVTTNTTLLEEHKKRTPPIIQYLDEYEWRKHPSPPKKATHEIIMSSRHPAPQKSRFAEVILQWPIPIVTEWNRWLLWIADLKVNDTISIPLQWDALPPSAWEELLELCAESEEFGCHYDTPVQKENRYQLAIQMQAEDRKVACSEATFFRCANPWTEKRIGQLCVICSDSLEHLALRAPNGSEARQLYEKYRGEPHVAYRGKYTVEIVKLE